MIGECEKCKNEIEEYCKVHVINREDLPDNSGWNNIYQCPYCGSLQVIYGD